MVAIETQEHIYPHPWDIVTLAQWSKYPHPLCPQVTQVDVLSRNLDSSGVLQTQRLFTGASPLPSWLKWAYSGLFSSNENTAESLCIEESSVDREKKRMEMRLRNIGWADWIRIEEVCVLEEMDDGKSTRLKQKWSCEINGGSLTRKLEDWARERFRSTVGKGREAVKMICDEIESGMEKVVEHGLESNAQTQ